MTLGTDEFVRRFHLNIMRSGFRGLDLGYLAGTNQLAFWYTKRD